MRSVLCSRLHVVSTNQNAVIVPWKHHASPWKDHMAIHFQSCLVGRYMVYGYEILLKNLCAFVVYMHN